ncbi:MAG: hypothetical protein IJ111_07795 [Eggerthellaceae bacterium]|nr:hypothetical protein [Eggerthellaceae bacterium]
MRPEFVTALTLAVLAIMLAFAVMIVDSQPKYSHQLHNPYWPFTVELSVRDR